MGNIGGIKGINQLTVKHGIVEDGHQRVILRPQSGIAIDIDALGGHIRRRQQRRRISTEMATEADIKQIRHEHHQKKLAGIV